MTRCSLAWHTPQGKEKRSADLGSARAYRCRRRFHNQKSRCVGQVSRIPGDRWSLEQGVAEGRGGRGQKLGAGILRQPETG